MIVLILSKYGEHGLEEPIRGTPDRSKTLHLFDEMFPGYQEERLFLQGLLAGPDAGLRSWGCERLGGAWGGPMLTVVEIE